MILVIIRNITADVNPSRPTTTSHQNSNWKQFLNDFTYNCYFDRIEEVLKHFES